MSKVERFCICGVADPNERTSYDKVDAGVGLLFFVLFCVVVGILYPVALIIVGILWVAIYAVLITIMFRKGHAFECSARWAFLAQHGAAVDFVLDLI